MAKLSTVEIKLGLKEIPEWSKRNRSITRTYQFKDFVAAIKFVNGVAKLAEKSWHHPDIDIRWNQVTLTFTTHDQGGLTDKDFASARQADRLAV
jgi:4a-hydroxytetrahydrobiopterin dehydratase